jgi:hypothetical protein
MTLPYHILLTKKYANCRHCRKHGDTRNEYRNLAGEHERKRLPGGPRHYCENNI